MRKTGRACALPAVASSPMHHVNRPSHLALCSTAGTSNFASLSHALVAAHGRRKRTAPTARYGLRARRLSAGELHQLRADARSACERSPRACACVSAIAAIASRSPLYARTNATSYRRWHFAVFAAREAAGPPLPSPAGLPASPAAREPRVCDFSEHFFKRFQCIMCMPCMASSRVLERSAPAATSAAEESERAVAAS